jgi:hypothetical protein
MLKQRERKPTTMARIMVLPAVEGTIHVVKSSFPMLVPRTGEVIADEQCECNHLRSEHYDQGGVVFEGEIIGFYGHGGCSIEGCQCNKYRFDDFIFQEEENGERTILITK